MNLFSNVKHDALGGLTTSVVAMPLAIAFGVAAFAPLGPEFIPQGALAGLYGSIVAGALASLFGGTPAQISGPTAPMAVVVTSVILKAMHDPRLEGIGATPHEAILLIVAVTIFLGGVFQLTLGLVGGGKLIKYIPYPVVAGFMNGIGVIIFMAQIRPFIGVDKAAEITTIVSGGAGFRFETILAGTVTIVATVIAPRYIKAVPGALIGLVAGVATFFTTALITSPSLLQLQGNDYILGPIPTGFPTPSQVFAFFRLVGDIPPSTWGIVVIPALTLSVLAAIDTLLTSVVSDIVTKTKHNSNRELVGQGIGNAMSGLFGGMPAAGSTATTMVNVKNGGRTPLSGVFKSLVVLLVVLILGPLVQWIPMSVLAGILLVTAVGMLDIKSFNLLKKKSAAENVLIVVAVTIVTVSVDIIVAVGVGLAIASFLFVKDQIGKAIVRRKYSGDVVHSKKVRDHSEMQLLEEKGDRIVVYELSGSLFFGTADKLFNHIEEDLQRFCVILDLKRVDTIDLTGAQLLRQIVERVQDRGNHILLSYLDVPGDRDKERVRGFLDDLGITELIGLSYIFEDTDHALEWAEDTLIRHITVETQLPTDILALRDLSVFKDLSDNQLLTVGPYLNQKEYVENDIVFSEGDPGDGMYFVLSGYVSVITGLNGTERARRLATFAKGVFFGDMAVLEGLPRSATVRAETETTVFFMSKAGFVRLTTEEPAVATQMLLGMARELSYRLRTTTAEVRALED